MGRKDFFDTEDSLEVFKDLFENPEDFCMTEYCRNNENKLNIPEYKKSSLMYKSKLRRFTEKGFGANSRLNNKKRGSKHVYVLSFENIQKYLLKRVGSGIFSEHLDLDMATNQIKSLIGVYLDIMKYSGKESVLNRRIKTVNDLFDIIASSIIERYIRMVATDKAVAETKGKTIKEIALNYKDPFA